MPHLTANVKRSAAFIVLSLVAGAAAAHTGHGTSGLVEGLEHPFGLDHLLAMVAVGVWSVSALPTHKAWWGPSTFMTALVISAGVGAAGVTVPYIENLVSLSVVLFGVMLMLSKVKLPTFVGLGLIAVAASLHGLAHGSEAPETGFLAYAVGFLMTTATLHFGGVAAGLGLRRFFATKASLLVQFFGLICSGAGIYLFSQI